MRLIIFFIIASVSSSARAQDNASTELWRAQMNEISQAYQEILPELFTVQPKLPAEYKSKVQKIYDQSRTLDLLGHAKMAPDADPAIPYIAQLLKDDIKRAYDTMEEPYGSYSKQILRGTLSYCVACHTRTSTGLQMPLISAFVENTKRLPWLDRVRLLTATRQFDAAIALIRTELSRREAGSPAALEAEKAARMGFSISVRVKGDPKESKELAKLVIASPSTSDYFRQDVRAWMADIEKWEKEPKLDMQSRSALLKKARELTGMNSKEKQIPAKAEIRFLRASYLMTMALNQKPTPEEAAEALYIIGRTYDMLRNLDLWTLHEMYYEACIRRLPHSLLAQRCFERYEEAVTLGYSGSSGVHIPGEVQKHIEELRKEANRN